MDDFAPPVHAVLVIDAPEALPCIEGLEPRPSAVLIRLRQLGPELLAMVRPDCVVLPLLRPGYDALQGLDRLASLGYAGPVCIFAPPLPAPAIVEAELRASHPQFELRFYTMPAD